jgi:leucyl/phenylalanyl-tRNA--protein transferase
MTAIGSLRSNETCASSTAGAGGATVEGLSLRGVLPLDDFHMPRSLRKRLRQGTFTVTIDTCFDAVMAGCAEATDIRADTWINSRIISLFNALHEANLAHSIEVWKDGALAGGLYGLAMGGAFFEI